MCLRKRRYVCACGGVCARWGIKPPTWYELIKKTVGICNLNHIDFCTVLAILVVLTCVQLYL